MPTNPSLSLADQPTDAVGPPGGTTRHRPAAPPAGPTPESGVVLGHFQVTEVLGRGGCGVVLKAFDSKLHRTVAVKVMSAEAAATPDARRRFLREARAAAAVRHANVVPIHAVEDGPLPYLVLEYLAGGSLQQRFDRVGQFTPDEVVRVGAQVARGLAAAHARGIVHRDVKPANILLDAGPGLVVKVGDFGLARVADDADVSQTGAVVGTPHYMSPEQARGEPVDERSDLFALGTVLYLLATGYVPFAAPSSAGVIRQVAYEPARPAHAVAPEVPQWLAAVISRLHALDPADRFRSATELADLLDDCAAQLAATGGVIERPPPARPARRARPRRPGFAAAAGLLAAAVAVLLVADPFRSPPPGAAPPPPPAHPPAAVPPPTAALPPLPPAANVGPDRGRNALGMEFARVPKGAGRLGGGDFPGAETVIFDADFFLGTTEVTQAQWDRVLGAGRNPSFYSRTGGHQGDVAGLTDDEVSRLPVDSLSWNACQTFLAALNDLVPEPGWVYRLPTRQEWEYACRGGPQGDPAVSAFHFYFGAPTRDLTPARANYLDSGLGRPVPVGSYPPNRLGLYDMHGNACELGDDRRGDFRPLLGGWWMDDSTRCRASWSGHIFMDTPFRGAGLRVARVPAPGR